jgi:acyl-CoA reductase-like NAD-dependent aldehyde dehydrogenase
VSLGPVLDAATEVANRITDNDDEVVATLTRYETWRTAVDESERTVRALRNLEREGDFIARIQPGLRVAAFLPINQPLYSLLLFGIMPALMGQEVVVRPSDVTGDLVPRLYELVSTAPVRQRLQVVRQARSRFVAQQVRRSDVTIFTGSYRNAAQVLRGTPPRSCFIFNGSGVNPIVVAPGADLEQATRAVIRAVTYNSGQDCASPDCILVDNDVADELVDRLSEGLRELNVGPNSERQTHVGPLYRAESMLDFVTFASRHRSDIVAGGTVDLGRQLVTPTLFRRSLGGTFSFPELYAPVANVATYRGDAALRKFFASDRYRCRAMYASVYGTGPDKIPDTEVLRNRLVLDHEDGNRPFGGKGVEASFHKIGADRPYRGPILVSEVLAHYSEWIGACASA